MADFYLDSSLFFWSGRHQLNRNGNRESPCSFDRGAPQLFERFDVVSFLFCPGALGY
jgi:hypothetical protein